MGSGKAGFAGIFILILVAVLVSANYASADLTGSHFICGQVLNSADNISASWFSVMVYYSSTPGKFTTCQVSPQDNKYCCDVYARDSSGNYLMGKAWKVGDVVDAEIYAPSLGYVAGPVSAVTTNQGYDVLPEMQIEKVIHVYSPNETLVISNKTEVFLNASFLSPYTNIILEKNGENSTLCEGCTNISEEINASDGYNSWKVFASENGSDGFSQAIRFFMLKEINLSRSFDCKKCKGDDIAYGENVNVTLHLNLSSPVQGLQLSEFVPSDFSIINVSGSLASYDNLTNEITWNVSGSSANFSYFVKVPDFNFFSKDSFCRKSYTFTAELEGKEISLENVSMKKLFGFCNIHHGRPYGAGVGSFYGNVYPVISLQNPYVLYGNGSIQKIAFFPNQTLENTQFNVLNLTGNIPYNNLKGALGYYLIQSKDANRLDSTYLEFKINRSQIPKNGVSFFSYDNGWKEQNFTVYRQDNNSIYFHGFFTGNAVAVVGNPGNFSLASMFNLRNYIYFRKITGSEFPLFL